MAITVTHPFVSAIADDPAAAAAGQVVPSNWNATHSISGTLDVANGGTGTTTSTGTGSVVLSSSPTLTTPNLGTPSAIVLTNASGTASININGTVGATTPATGAFTTLTTTGNTIVSVTDNTNAALRVTQTGTANALEIEDSTNPDATPVIVNNSGQLVIGNTAAVSTKLGIQAATPFVQAHGIVQQTSSFGSYGYSSNAFVAGFYSFHKSKSGTVGTLSSVTDGDLLGTIQWNGADNDATSTFNPAAYIQATCAGTVGTTSVPGRLTFWTTAVSATAPTQRVTITQEGYVGIGATPNSAAQLLDLRGTNNALTSDTAVNTLRFTDTDTTTAANQPIGKIEFYNSDTGNAAVGAYILASSVGTAGGGTIRFGAAADAGVVAEIVRISSSGLTVVNAVSVGSTGATTGSLLINGSTSGTVTVTTAATAGTWTMTLPTSAGTNGYVLSTNGSGVTSWVAQSGGGGGGSSAGSDIYLANNFGGF